MKPKGNWDNILLYILGQYFFQEMNFEARIRKRVPEAEKKPLNRQSGNSDNHNYQKLIWLVQVN